MFMGRSLWGDFQKKKIFLFFSSFFLRLCPGNASHFFLVFARQRFLLILGRAAHVPCATPHALPACPPRPMIAPHGRAPWSCSMKGAHVAVEVEVCGWWKAEHGGARWRMAARSGARAWRRVTHGGAWHTCTTSMARDNVWRRICMVAHGGVRVVV